MIKKINIKKIMWSYLKTEKKYLIPLVISAFILGSALFAIPYITKAFSQSAMDKDQQMIIVMIIIILVIMISRILFRFLTSYIGRLMGIKIEVKMRRDAFKKMYKLKYEYFDTHAPGSFVSNLTNDPKTIYSVSFSIITESIFAIMGFAGGISFAFINSWLVGISIIVIYGIGLTVTYFNAKKLQKFVMESKVLYSWMNTNVTSQATSISEIKSYNSFEFEQLRNEVLNNEFLINKKQTSLLQSTFNATSLGVALIIQMGILIISGLELYFGSIDKASFTAFISLSTILIMPINRIASLFNQFSDGISSLKRFGRFMNLPEEKQTGSKFISKDGVIEFKDVDFSYIINGQTKDVLKNFNLIIRKGQKIAFVGKSGVGKSTILKLILGFYEIQKGQILVDGQDIAKVNINELRENISYIQQSGIIFDGTLKENIMYKTEDISEEKFNSLLKDSKLNKFVRENKHGSSTMLGTNGSQISGGQKQRVSIARAMLADNNIILLDEATSALDNKTEKDIQESIDFLFKTKTTVTVAHRISTIMNSDIIYYIKESGNISESGTYKELMSLKGDFFNLVKTHEY